LTSSNRVAASNTGDTRFCQMGMAIVTVGARARGVPGLRPTPIALNLKQFRRKTRDPLLQKPLANATFPGDKHCKMRRVPANKCLVFAVFEWLNPGALVFPNGLLGLIRSSCAVRPLHLFR